MVRNREFISVNVICFGLRAHVDVLVRERFIYKVGYFLIIFSFGCMSDHYSHILKLVS